MIYNITIRFMVRHLPSWGWLRQRNLRIHNLPIKDTP